MYHAGYFIAFLMFKDYYNILGITKEASEKDIKKSFRSLAMEFHPDSNDDPYAHQKFLDINEAYQILGDTLKRKKYDNRYDFLKHSNVNGGKAYTNGYNTGYYSASQTYNYRPKARTRRKKGPSRFQEFSKYTTFARVIAYVALIFSSVIILDYFMAKTTSPEVVMSGSLIQGPAGDMILRIKTNQQDFLLDYKHFEQLGRGDKVSLRTTPIFNITTHLYVYRTAQIPQGKLSELLREPRMEESVYSLTPHYGIYNVFSFFLIMLFTAAIVGVFLKNRPEFLFNLSLLNGLLMIITFVILINS